MSAVLRFTYKNKFPVNTYRRHLTLQKLVRKGSVTFANWKFLSSSYGSSRAATNAFQELNIVKFADPLIDFTENIDSDIMKK